MGIRGAAQIYKRRFLYRRIHGVVDSSNRFALSPLSRCSRGRASCLPISSSVPKLFRQLASYVPCAVEQPIRPLRGHLSIPGKVVTDCQFFLFPHMCLEGVVQKKHKSTPPAAPEPPFSRVAFVCYVTLEGIVLLCQLQ